MAFGNSISAGSAMGQMAGCNATQRVENFTLLELLDQRINAAAGELEALQTLKKKLGTAGEIRQDELQKLLRHIY